MRRLIVSILMAVLMLVPSAAMAVGRYTYLTLGAAKTRVDQAAGNYREGTPNSYWRSAPDCFRVNGHTVECTVDLWYNAAATQAVGTLTYDTWNGQTASNGRYWSHTQLASMSPTSSE